MTDNSAAQLELFFSDSPVRSDIAVKAPNSVFLASGRRRAPELGPGRVGGWSCRIGCSKLARLSYFNKLIMIKIKHFFLLNCNKTVFFGLRDPKCNMPGIVRGRVCRESPPPSTQQ
jgi:hypothetical protein